MRSPLDARFKKTQQLMKSGMMVGLDRPVSRVTYAKQRIRHVTSNKHGIGQVRYLNTDNPEHELLTIRTIDIDRSIGQDAATCSITIYNMDPRSSQPDGDTLDRRGYMTPGRGVPSKKKQTSVYDNVDDFYGTVDNYPTGWGLTQNQYRDVLIPNTVLRTYQGYGSDNFDVYGNEYDVTDPNYVEPAGDTKLYMTGVWLIDNVTFNADGTASIECRDLGKLLIEQYIYPPLIPTDRFPLIYCPAHKATGHKEHVGANVAKFHSSSVDRQLGKNHKVLGHRGSDAFDTRGDTFWLSNGNDSVHDYAWIQARTHGQVNEVVLHAHGGNYVAYVCVHENGKWQGTKTIDGTDQNYENLGTAEGNGGGGGYFYTITSGDTLWDLAGRYYDNNLLWPRIAAINSNIIRDPHWIYPGQRIKIPYIAGTKTPPPANGTGQTGGSNAQITYVTRVTIPKSGKVTVRLPRTYKADHVRVTMTNLNEYKGARRAGMRSMVVRNHVTNTYHPSTINKAGYIQDWTEPIKEMCAWAGLTWVDASPNPADPVLGTSTTPSTVSELRRAVVALRQRLTSGNLTNAQKAAISGKIDGLTAQIAQIFRGHANKPLRVWGDFEILGAGPVVCTPGDYFLAKSFMEGIRQISDFIGGVFYIDESGGAQFRLPNIWSQGVFIDDTSAASSLGARIKELPIEFHEDANLVEYSMVISDASLRSEILVIGGYPGVHSKGPVAGGYVLGYNSATGTTSAIDFSDVLAGQYRLMVAPGDATKLFYTEAECQRMAELTAMFILFTYRQGTLSAPCHPGLQIDDQVRIFERVTSEAHVHYVSAIRTHFDAESGAYTMEVTTHWLGDDPNKNWFVNKAQLTPAVLRLPAIMKRVGREAGGDEFEQPPYGVTG